jgi:hypothetical protein
MIGIDPLVMTSLLVLASGGKTLACPDHEPTQINVQPVTEEVQYDYSQGLKALQGYSMDTVDPYSFHGQTVTQGFMKGGVSLEQKLEFGQALMKRYGAACVWYDTITVKIKIDPTIVIASELYKDPCMKKAVIGHELKHVRVDREIVNKYARVMGKKLFSELKSRGFEAGPFPAEDMEGIMSKMQRVVKQILEFEVQKMSIERTEKQRDVDSLDEYNRVDELCPAFKTKKKKLYDSLRE